MAENKTQKRDDLSVADYLSAIESDERHDDCLKLAAIMQGLTGQPPHMYGHAIVGFDTYHYRYESGREGEAPVLAFSSRKTDLTLYLSGTLNHIENENLLNQLGKHKASKGCLYVKRLSDLDLGVLERLLVWSRDTIRAKYPN